MDKVEFLILRNLLYNEQYTRKVIPFIKAEYFEDVNQKIVFEEILNFIQEYNQLATKEVLCIEIENRKDINETSFNEIIHLINHLDDVPVEFEWLVNTTEKWCRDRAIYLALMEAIQVADGKDQKRIGIQFHQFFKMLLQYLLILTLDTIILRIMNSVMSLITERRRKLNLILNISTKSQRVVSLTKLSISHLLVRASGSLYSCAMWLAPSCSKDGTYCTLRLKWQRSALQKGLTLTS